MWIEAPFMDIRLIQTPSYYNRQFSLSLGKVHTFYLNQTCLIQTPINADNRHLLLAHHNQLLLQLSLSHFRLSLDCSTFCVV